MVEDWSVEQVSASTAIERGSVGFESTDNVQRVTKAARVLKMECGKACAFGEGSERERRRGVGVGVGLWREHAPLP